MFLDIASMKSEELLNLFNKMDADVNKQLLSGASWDSIKDQVDNLTELSKELMKRKIQVNPTNTSPADTQLRMED